MNATQRRSYISELLANGDAPQSATTLATQFAVSRQIIVGDIALLRAGGLAVTATPRGYILERTISESEYTLACQHDDAGLAEELYTVIDLGGTVLDVTVSHCVYGQICAQLHLASHYDIELFLDKLHSSGARPLCDLTGGVHLHRVRCADADAFARITDALRAKHFLYEK